MALIVSDGHGNPLGEAMMNSEGRMVVVANGEVVATADGQPPNLPGEQDSEEEWRAKEAAQAAAKPTLPITRQDHSRHINVRFVDGCGED
jgi:hypothetical protein